MIKGQPRILVSRRSQLLQQHPVLTPLILLIGSAGLFAASFFSDALFPILSFIGAPSALLCVLVALVLGVSGLLTGIISILEGIDRRHFRAAMFPQPKEHSYDSH